MKNILRFAVNVPAVVALANERGNHVEGRYGDQVMYTLADDRVIYVPPAVEARLEELAIAAGEPFEIVKREMRNGTRKWIEWQVRKVPPEEVAATPVAEELPLSDPPQPGGAGTGAPAPEAEGGGTNGTANGHAGPALPALPDPISGGGIHAMDLALNGAAEIAQRVESRAARKGYSLRFTSEDIRAIGLTLFIQAMRDGGVVWQR